MDRYSQRQVRTLPVQVNVTTSSLDARIPSAIIFLTASGRILWSQTEQPWLSPFAFGSVLDDALNKDYRDIVLQRAAAQPQPSDQFIDCVGHR
jgi:hypothetical protein